MPKSNDPEHFNANPSGKVQGGMSIYELAAMNADPDAVPDQAEAVQDTGERIECSTCGRKFNPTAISKHENICQRVFMQKRKAFNIKEQRKTDGMGEIEEENKYNKPFGRKKQSKAGGNQQT